jgi:hypothetical protein
MVLNKEARPTLLQTSGAADLLVDAARSWGRARQAGRPVQPCVFRTLCARDCGLAAPAVDSLMVLCEAALRRPLALGASTARSDDERLLVALVQGATTRDACIDCPAGLGAALDSAAGAVQTILVNEARLPA